MNNVNRAIPPKIQPIEAFPLMQPRHTMLSNGVPAYYFDNPNLDLIHILLQVRTGSLYQPQKHVCNFAYSLLKESSPTLSSDKISERIDYYGVNFNVNIGLDNVQIMISVPKHNLSEILPDIADFTIQPKYRSDNLRLMLEKEAMNLAYNELKTDYNAWRMMWKEMLGDFFPAVSSFASRETIFRLTPGQLKAFHRESFCAERVTLFATGNLDTETEELLQRTWAAIPHGTAAPTLPTIPSKEEERRLIYQPLEGSLQSSLLLCSLSMSFNDLDRRPFSVLNTLTGGYFSSRLMQNLRERQGLTYGVSSTSTFFGNQSIFSINSDVNADLTQRALDACFEEMRRLQEEPVSSEELDMAKNYMAGIQLRSADTTVSTMQKFAYWKRFGLDETEMYRYLKEIQSVTPDTIILLAKKYFSDNKFTRIVVGKYLECE